jgi:hypothetical protein
MERVEIRLPISYSAMVKHKGARNAVKEYFVDWTDVSIPSFVGAEAPVAARWVSTRLVDRDETVCERRYLDGRFWVPAQEKHPHQGDASLEALRSPTNAANGKSALLIPIMGNDHMLPILKFIEEGETNGRPEDYREATDIRREEIVGRIEAHTRNYVFIDDVLWTPVNQPVLSLIHEPGLHTDWLTLCIVHPENPYKRNNPDRVWNFNLNDLDAAIEFHDDRTADRVVRDENYYAFGQTFKDLEILIPEVFDLELDANNVVQFAAKLVEEAEDRLAKRSDEEILRFVVFRRAVRDYQAIPSDVTSDKLAEMIVTMAEDSRNSDFNLPVAMALRNKYDMRTIRLGGPSI